MTLYITMKKLFILRHGHRLDQADVPAWRASARYAENTSDTPLTAIGETNSANAGAELCAFLPEIERIYTSPMTRCVQTAEFVAKSYEQKLNRKLIIHKHYGLTEAGNILDDVIINYKTAEETMRQIGAETTKDEIVRVMTTICEIVNSEPGNVLIVGHSGTLAYFYYLVSQQQIKPTYNFCRPIDTNKLVGFSIENGQPSIIYSPNNDFANF
jgi:broad specificity phosphatase PhoE